MRHFNFLLFTVLAVTTVFTSCKKDADEAVNPLSTQYSVPTTYNGNKNVNYSDQTAVLNFLTSIDNQTKLGTTTTLDANNLKAMYEGLAGTNPVNIQALTSSYTAQSLLASFMDSIAIASQSHSNTSPAKGVAGVGSYQSPTATKPSLYLMSGKGINYQQLISKMMYGAVLYNQIVFKLSEQSIGNNVDNNTVYADQGTLMEHHWDEAFGYFGVPDSFPTKTTGIRYLGSYSNQVNAGIGSNQTLMNAYLKGRAAITNKDYDTKNAQAQIIVNEFERMLAACAIHELNGLSDVTNQFRINSVLSEAYGFVLALKYSPRQKISNVQLDKIIGYFGTNMYDITQTDINNIKNDLASIYGFTNADSI